MKCYLYPSNIIYIRFVNQFIHEIISEHGAHDLDLLHEKLRNMRILENIELPNSVIELLNNTKVVPAIDPVGEIDVDDDDIMAIEGKKEEDDGGNEVGEEDGGDPVGEDTENKIQKTFKVDPKQPMMVRMANLCVVGGFSVNGVAEIHSEIVKEEVFNEFYKVTTPVLFHCCYKQLITGISA